MAAVCVFTLSCSLRLPCRRCSAKSGAGWRQTLFSSSSVPSRRELPPLPPLPFLPTDLATCLYVPRGHWLTAWRPQGGEVLLRRRHHLRHRRPEPLPEAVHRVVEGREAQPSQRDPIGPASPRRGISEFSRTRRMLSRSRRRTRLRPIRTSLLVGGHCKPSEKETATHFRCPAWPVFAWKL